MTNVALLELQCLIRQHHSGYSERLETCEGRVFESFRASRYQNTAVKVSWDTCRSIKVSADI